MIDSLSVKLRQSLRFGRLGINLGGGAALIEYLHRFPKLSGIQNHHLNDYRLFNFWVKDLVHSMNVELTVSGSAPVKHGLFVSNHISWLDTIILNHAKPLSFIARHDLVEWPGIGTFTQRMHSVYVDRSSKFHAYRSIPRITERLNEGRSVLVFPESTTSDGKNLLHFHPMFYEAAVRTGLPVQPVLVRYTDQRGSWIGEPAFIDDDSFVDTLSRILETDKVYGHLHYLEPLNSKELSRKQLCWESRKAIGKALVRGS